MSMETKIISQSDNQAIFTVILDSAEIEKGKKHVFDVHLRPKVKVSGFRPGKAPDYIVERELGSNAVQGEVLDELIQNSYSDAIRKLELPVVASPQVSIEKFAAYTELEYKATVELMPPVKLGEYKKIRVKKASVSIKKDDIDQTISDLRRREATRLETEEKAKLTDEINFDFSGSQDGTPVQGASAKNQTLQLGSGNFIPGFEDELVGLKKGDSKSFKITFPKDYHQDSLAGAVVLFDVTVNGVTQLILPDIDESFIKKVSPYKTEAELRDDISQRLASQKNEENAREYEQKVIDKVVSGADAKAPEALVKQQLVRVKQELEQNLAYSGLDMAKYLEMSGKSEEDIDKELYPEAERRVTLAMVLTEVSKQEDINVENKEIDSELENLKKDYPDPATQAQLDNPDTREEIYNRLMASKVIAKLISYASADDK